MRTKRVRATRENPDYLPGVRLPESIRVTSDIVDCADADLIVFVTPSTALRSVANQLRASISDSKVVFLSGTKGIEHGTGMRMSEILEEIFPRNTVAVISGPNLAVEVSRDLPTATVLGCKVAEWAEELQRHLGSERFRIYSSDETIGIELGGALKNVFAIPAGVSDGFGLDDNSKAALVTRAIVEMKRLGVACGAQAETFTGLSGLGDLIVTCFSRLSRNRGFGERVGQGEKPAEIAASMVAVAEGYPTTRSAFQLGRRHHLSTPVLDEVNAMLYEGKNVAQAVHDLMSRDLKAED